MITKERMDEINFAINFVSDFLAKNRLKLEISERNGNHYLSVYDSDTKKNYALRRENSHE